MWVSKLAMRLLETNKDTVDQLRWQVIQLMTEKDALASELATTKANFSWITTRLNAVEMERAILLDNAYGVKVAVPEIVRTHAGTSPPSVNDIFEDMGDEVAKKLGFPVYEN